MITRDAAREAKCSVGQKLPVRNWSGRELLDDPSARIRRKNIIEVSVKLVQTALNRRFQVK